MKEKKIEEGRYSPTSYSMKGVGLSWAWYVRGRFVEDSTAVFPSSLTDALAGIILPNCRDETPNGDVALDPEYVDSREKWLALVVPKARATCWLNPEELALLSPNIEPPNRASRPRAT